MPSNGRDVPGHRGRAILLATDFSDASARARDYAIALAAPGATVTLVQGHLLPVPDWPAPEYAPDWMPAEPSVREEALERLRLFAAPLRAAGLSVETVLQEGFPADVILAQAAALMPDLIAMGTHGRRRFERWMMGSTAERVMRLAPVPVLTVSAQALPPPPRIRELLCPVSLEAGAETLAVASRVAARCTSVLTVLHVLESSLTQVSGDRAERQARQRLSDMMVAASQRVHAEALVRTGCPSREILQVAHDRAVDVIVMGVHDRCQADQGFFGSTADQVVREAKCGVITVRPAAGRGFGETPEAGLASVGE